MTILKIMKKKVVISTTCDAGREQSHSDGHKILVIILLDTQAAELGNTLRDSIGEAQMANMKDT